MRRRIRIATTLCLLAVGPALRAMEPPERYQVVIFNDTRQVRELQPEAHGCGILQATVAPAKDAATVTRHPVKSSTAIQLPPFARVTLRFLDPGRDNYRYLTLAPTSAWSPDGTYIYLQDGQEGIKAHPLNKRICRPVGIRELCITELPGSGCAIL